MSMIDLLKSAKRGRSKKLRAIDSDIERESRCGENHRRLGRVYRGTRIKRSA